MCNKERYKPLSGEGIGKWMPKRQKPYRKANKNKIAPTAARSFLTPEIKTQDSEHSLKEAIEVVQSNIWLECEQIFVMV